MDKMISRFSLEGVSSDDKLLRTKESATIELTCQMKDQGYVPVLDLDHGWMTQMNEDQNIEFKLAIHGVYVGVDKAWQYSGITGGKLVPSTPKSK